MRDVINSIRLTMDLLQTLSPSFPFCGIESDKWSRLEGSTENFNPSNFYGKISNIPLKLVLFPDLPSLSRNNSRFVAFLIQSKEMIKS